MHDRLSRKQVTSNMSTNFYRSALVGETLYIITKTDKIGKNMGFATVNFYNKDCDLLYKSNATLVMIDEKWHF